MELRQVKYFLEVAEFLHFGKAANKIGITQPALSQQIKLLEEELGGVLFHRTRQKVYLTEAGKIFYKHAATLVNYADETIEMVKKCFSGNYGDIRIGFVESATLDILPKIMENYHKNYPEVNAILQHVHTEKQIELLAKNQLDVGIMGYPPDSDKLDFYVLRTEPYWVALPNKHPLCYKESIDIKELSSEKFITTNREVGKVYYDKMIQICLEAGFSPEIVQQANEMQTILSFVSGNMGIALIHESAQKLRNDIVYKPLTGVSNYAYKPCIAWKKDPSSIIQNYLNLSINLIK